MCIGGTPTNLGDQFKDDDYNIKYIQGFLYPEWEIPDGTTFSVLVFH